MKKEIISAVFIVVIFFGFSFQSFSQTDQFSKDVRYLLEINGSKEQFEMTSQRIIKQFKKRNRGVRDSVWTEIKTNVIRPAFKELNEKLVPVYKDHFTHKEIKALIAFYESETGKMLVKKQAKMQPEILTTSQKWGRQLARDIQMKINGY